MLEIAEKTNKIFMYEVPRMRQSAAKDSCAYQAKFPVDHRLPLILLSAGQLPGPRLLGCYPVCSRHKLLVIGRQ